MAGRTLYDKIWQSHSVGVLPTGQTQLFIGLHLIHEITTAPAFDMLRENGQGELALREYEASNKATPRRLRGLYGAAKAAQMSDQADKAASYFLDLAQLAAHADTDRPELTEARQFLARR